MLSKRIIPLFLLKGSRLVKGTCFTDYIDVGDPLSQAMIYDAQGADEIMVVDIDATREGRIIDPAIINGMITKCRLPIAAGGGIKSIEDARTCFGAGADKIVVNTHAVLNPELVRQLAAEFGAQSVVVSIDVRKDDSGDYPVYVKSGQENSGKRVEQVVQELVAAGAGELVITSVDREGTLKGLDVDLYRRIRSMVPIPMIASGGVGSYDHMVEMFKQSDCDGCGVGKMLFLRDYDIVRIKAYLNGRKVAVRDA